MAKTLPHDTSRTSGQEWSVTASHFGLTIDSITGKGELGRFQKVSGLGVKLDFDEVVEGGQNQYIHKLPGRMRWEDLQLERGIIYTDRLLDWLQSCSGLGLAQGKVPRKTGVLTMYAADGKRLRTWSFEGAFPVKWSGPSFDADSNTIITEKLVIAHDGITPGH